MSLKLRFSAIALLGAALAACSTGPKPETLGRLGFMVGCWRSADGLNQEVWSAPAGNVMFGYATTMQGGALSFFEQSRIDLRQAQAAYTASPDGQRPVVFTEPRNAATPAIANAVTFENGDHDYPQRIVYRATKTGLAATISKLDGSRVTQYAWTKCKN